MNLIKKIALLCALALALCAIVEAKNYRENPHNFASKITLNSSYGAAKFCFSKYY